MNVRQARKVVFAAALAIASAAHPSWADGSVTVGSDTLVDFKGFGIYPAPYDRQRPTYADGTEAWGDSTWLGTSGPMTSTGSSGGLYNAFNELSFDIVRTYITPTIGNSNNTLNTTRLQDLKDHLQSFKNMGVSKYILTVWSPPAHMKLPDRVRYGKYQGRVQYLDSAYADGSGYDYADYLVAVLTDLKAAGFAAPLGLSIQNEPSVDSPYDGCVWNQNSTQKNNYRTVIKQLRAKLNAKNDSWFTNIQIQATDEGSYNSITESLGAASSSGFADLNNDTAFRDALGAFTWHTYATSGDIKEIRSAMLAYPGKDRWMTEYSHSGGVRNENWGEPSMSLRPYAASTGGSGNEQLNYTLDFFRRMGGDLVDLRANYWFFWRGWHVSSYPSAAEDLLYGPENTPTKQKAYFAFQKLWQIVDAGWKVKKVTDTDYNLRTDNEGLITSDSGDQWSAPVDIIGFESGDATKSCVVLTNFTGSSKNITSLSGLKGGTANIWVTTSTQDMAAQSSRTVSGGTLQGGNLTLPAYSITIVATSGSAQSNPNLISNPSFESEQFGTQTPSGWSEWSSLGGAGAGYTESHGGSSSGNYHGTHWSGSAYNIYTYQIKTGLTNGLYTLRAKARRNNGTPSACYLEAKDFGGNARMANIPVSSTYQPLEIKDINVTNGQCTIGIWSNANAGNWCYFDDVEFFKQ